MGAGMRVHAGKIEELRNTRNKKNMALKADPPKSSVPEGEHPAICIGVWDLGHQKSFAGTELEHKVALAFAFENGKILTKEYNLYVGLIKKNTAPSKLLKDIGIWQKKISFSMSPSGDVKWNIAGVIGPDGHCLVRAEHLALLVGKHANIQVTLNKNGYAQIEAILPPTKTDWDTHHAKTVFQIEDQIPPTEMPNWMVKRVNESEELRGHAGAGEESQAPAAGHGGGEQAGIPF